MHWHCHSSLFFGASRRQASHLCLRFLSSDLNKPRRRFADWTAAAGVPAIFDPASSDVYSCNRALSNIGRTHGVHEARALFDRMPHRDVVTSSTMVALHIKAGELPQAEALFRQSPHRGVVMESAMIDGYAKAGRIEDAQRLFDEMSVRNVVSWTSLMSGYCLLGRVDEARRLFDEMPERNVVTWTSMVLGYSRNRLLPEARKLFERMPEKNVVSWTTMIKAYCENGQVAEARELFDKMPHRNVYSWNVMISGYLNNEQANQAISLFHSMPHRDAVSWTTMVTGLARIGLIHDAREFFDRMPEKDNVAWNAMITAYSNHGYSYGALEVFSQMLRHGTKPDEVTFVGVLSACGHAGLVEKGKHIFRAMKLAYSLIHKAEHYSCMVNMLGRAGLVEEAEKVFNSIPEEARDGAALGALLAGCMMHSRIDVASRIVEGVAESDTLGSGGYVLLANAYASQARWDDVARMRKTMKEKKVNKAPGFSQVELEMEKHMFFSGDQSHPETEEIYRLLKEDILPQMKTDYAQTIQFTDFPA